MAEAKKMTDNNGKVFYEVDISDTPESVRVTCVFCRTPYVFKGVRMRDVCDGSRDIQDIFPDMDPSYREMFISNICPECWDKMFSDEEGTDD